MKELFSRFFWKKPRDILERGPPQTNQSQKSIHVTEINPKENFQLRISQLKDEAKARHMQGGDAEVEQTMMELVAMAMTTKREEYRLDRQKIAEKIGLSKQDYLLAEAAILEPEKLFDALPSWLMFFHYDEHKFMEDLDTGAKIAIAYRGDTPPLAR